MTTTLTDRFTRYARLVDVDITGMTLDTPEIQAAASTKAWALGDRQAALRTAREIDARDQRPTRASRAAWRTFGDLSTASKFAAADFERAIRAANPDATEAQIQTASCAV